MALREPEDIRENDAAPSVRIESVSASDVKDTSSQSHTRLQVNGIESIDEEYHTDPEDKFDENVEEDTEEESLSEEDRLPGPLLLPAELLQPLPSPAYSPQNAVNIPMDQMTKQQKRNLYAKLRQDTKGTGVLKAGRIAQLRRRIVSTQDRARSGRVEKTTKVQASGRMQLLEQRKRAVEQSERELMRPSKKAKTKTKG